MRFLSYRRGDEQRLGLLVGEGTVVDLAETAALAQELGLAADVPALPSEMLAFIAAGDDAVEAAGRLERALVAVAREGGVVASLRERGALHDLDKVRVLAPIPRPTKNIFCLGLNYADHAEEGARARGRPVMLPEHPAFFTKVVTAVVGPEDDIELDERVTTSLDYEAEMAFVIGRRGKNIPAAEAYDHVFGYTIVNDISARELQRQHIQWFKGKSIDTSCPMGPYIAHKEQVPDPMNLAVALRVNGEERQRSSTARMIFTIPQIIESLSLGLTLEPGDIIATGTPSGVGFARVPPVFLQDGDVVEVEIEGLGVLRNRVRAVRG